MAIIILLFDLLSTMNKRKGILGSRNAFFVFYVLPLFPYLYIYAINYKYERPFILITF